MNVSITVKPHFDKLEVTHKNCSRYQKFFSSGYDSTCTVLQQTKHWSETGLYIKRIECNRNESSAIERLCLKFYKYILAVAQSSVNAAIYWELGLFPIGRDCKLRAIEYLLYLMSHQSSQLLKDALQLSISLAEKELNSWFYQIIAYISTLGLQCSYNRIPPIQEITYRINDIFTQDLLYRIDNQAGVTTSGGNKLRFYSTITHQVHQMADCLLTIENFSIRRLFTRFRISNHNLMIEKGRHHSPPLAISMIGFAHCATRER